MIEFKSCSDEELVLIYKSGNNNAYNELYNRYAPKLKKLIYYYILNTEDVEDVFHEVNIKVFMHINSFNEKLQFSSWIYKIAINCSKNHIKNKKRIDTIVEREKYRMIDDKVRVNTPEEDVTLETVGDEDEEDDDEIILLDDDEDEIIIDDVDDEIAIIDESEDEISTVEDDDFLIIEEDEEK